MIAWQLSLGFIDYQRGDKDLSAGHAANAYLTTIVTDCNWTATYFHSGHPRAQQQWNSGLSVRA
jgi:hypothetical protein